MARDCKINFSYVRIVEFIITLLGYRLLGDNLEDLLRLRVQSTDCSAPQGLAIE